MYINSFINTIPVPMYQDRYYYFCRIFKFNIKTAGVHNIDLFIPCVDMYMGHRVFFYILNTHLFYTFTSRFVNDGVSFNVPPFTASSASKQSACQFADIKSNTSLIYITHVHALSRRLTIIVPFQRKQRSVICLSQFAIEIFLNIAGSALLRKTFENIHK